jgi:uncharacterized protein YeaO (DUF488 family)
MMKIKRWNDPKEPDDGFRLLVCRYRPRALPKKDETWNAWWKDLGPSKELHADIYGKHGDPIPWSEFRRRYLKEMKNQKVRIAELGRRVHSGEIQDLQWGVFILGKGFSGPDSRSWISDFGEIYVRLSDDGKVTAKMMVPSPLGGFSPYFRFLPWAYMSLRALQVLPDKERN